MLSIILGPYRDSFSIGTSNSIFEGENLHGAEIRIEAELVNLGVSIWSVFFPNRGDCFCPSNKALPEQKLRVAKDMKDYLQGEIYREMIYEEAEIKARDSSKLV